MPLFHTMCAKPTLAPFTIKKLTKKRILCQFSVTLSRPGRALSDSCVTHAVRHALFFGVSFVFACRATVKAALAAPTTAATEAATKTSTGASETKAALFLSFAVL